MNVAQIQYHLRHIVKQIANKNRGEIESECLRVIHKYSMYFIGNKDYLQDYQDNKITFFGLLSQLVEDICITLANQYGPGGAAVGLQRIETSTIQQLSSELCDIVYGKQ